MRRPPDEERRPPKGAPSTSPNNSAPHQGNQGQGSRYEWRVTWRRAAWWPNTSDKSRTFCSGFAAGRFIDKLAGTDRPGLSPLTVLRVDRRHVGTWERVTS